MALQFRSARSSPSRGWRRAAWGLLIVAVAVVALREYARVEAPGPRPGNLALAQDPPAPLPAGLKLPAEAWATVRDDTVFRGGDHEAFYQLLSQLARIEPAQLRAASLGTVGFLPLSQQTADYRGQIVTVRGIARRAVAVKAEPNELGLERFFQVWIRPEDTTAGPLVVYCLELPPGFPMGQEIDAPVEVDAVVFKRWAYTATDGTRTAPLLLARNLTWKPDRAVVNHERSPNWALVIAAALAISASAVGWIWYSSPARRRPDPQELASS